ncbi:prepilin-type N-terminal cleavage/methylation domain-containing protein [Ideonella dechloratans]|uniref:Prepilin-type N-terminal cleavage/methylation domain-containing protein n=1 Tax=Ideonella dechloratans TaxID=36863 RepID=A0A643F6K7_IDEDE|nr:prepilin-type N-terminal cleavage/methylation domain-containing protein [Ideonella dechloratans]KAB0574154.1 prepilin-type N-terminal cleavage/methylation domain-containing protein [Ideonella dechloratans]UFU10611.1 type II secretion system GspH family protein [Ideonella dechloratans]
MTPRCRNFSRVRGPGRGFTLIELLVVLAIVALLGTLALPRYYGQVEAAKETALRENLRTLREVLDRFYGDTGRYPESLQELVDRRYLRSLPVDPLTDSTASWVVVPPPAGYAGKVYDIRSIAAGVGKNGQPYAKW